MTQDDQISFSRFHDEIDNQSFMGQPSEKHSKAGSPGATPAKDRIMSEKRSRSRPNKENLKVSQSFAEP